MPNLQYEIILNLAHKNTEMYSGTKNTAGLQALLIRRHLIKALHMKLLKAVIASLMAARRGKN